MSRCTSHQQSKEQLHTLGSRDSNQSLSNPTDAMWKSSLLRATSALRDRFGSGVLTLSWPGRILLTLPFAVASVALFVAMISLVASPDPRGAAFLLFMLGTLLGMGYVVLPSVWQSRAEWKSAKYREEVDRRSKRKKFDSPPAATQLASGAESDWMDWWGGSDCRSMGRSPTTDGGCQTARGADLKKGSGFDHPRSNPEPPQQTSRGR